MYVRTYVRIYLYLYVCMYVCMYVYVCICYVMYVCMYVLCMCMYTYTDWLMPVAVRSKAWVCGRSIAVIVCSDPACCVLLGRVLRVGLITGLEEFYRVWCV